MFVFYKKIIETAVVSMGIVLMGLVLAPTARALTLIPPSLELGLVPGEASKTAIKLYNETQENLELYTEPRDFTANGETGQPVFDFTNPVSDLSSWVKIQAGPIVLKPGERYEVPVTIDTPKNADPGGHYAAIFFSTTPPQDTPGQVRIASKVGTLILASVDGILTEQGSIKQFAVAGGKTVFSHPPVTFSARFSNTGNVHLRPTGTIKIANMFGKTVSTVEFNASKGATLPGTTRKYEAVWEKNQVRGASGSFISRFWQEYLNEKNNFGIGKYRATLAISVGTVQDTARLSFWLIPWHVIIFWLVVAVIAVFAIIFLVKRYNAWILKKAGK